MDPEPSALRIASWRVRWWWHARRERTVMWLAWHLPKEIVEWCCIRVMTANPKHVGEDITRMDMNTALKLFSGRHPIDGEYE